MREEVVGGHASVGQDDRVADRTDAVMTTDQRSPRRAEFARATQRQVQLDLVRRTSAVIHSTLTLLHR